MTEFFHHTESDTLVYRGDPGQLPMVIPECKRVNGEYFAIPRTLRNLQVMRHLNYPVTPIMDGYAWPRSPQIKQPYESQMMAANFMVLHRRCFNLSDMGVGKTLTTLWAADWLMSLHARGSFRAIVIAPLSILQRVWADAIFKNFLSGRTFAIMHGDAAKRRRELDRDVDFYIINFHGVGTGAHTRKKFELAGFSKELAGRDDIRLAIVDEASAYKDASIERHRIAQAVFGKKEYLWLLSGTPTPNAPTDAYGLAKLVNNAYGKSFKRFQLETMYKMDPQSFRWFPQRDGYDKARQLLTPAVRIDIREVWDAPEMTTQQREVPLTTEQQTQMKQLKKDLQVQVASGALINTANEAAARQKFMQISMGAIYDEAHKVHLVDAKPRYDELLDVIEQAPGKVLCFVPLTSVVNIVYKLLKTHYTVEIVNGEVSQKDRSRIFGAFQDAVNPRIIVADPGTTSHGLDLFAAQTVIWFGCTDKAELYAQANKRAHRPGQKYPVTVVQITSNVLEREIFKRLENNLSLQGVLLDAVTKGEF
jgi:SNF2 family DNA or RNA helicase